MKKQFAVFGLGSFGESIALELQKLGCEVIAVDKDMERVNGIADSVSYAMQADIGDPEFIRSLGTRNLDAVVIAEAELAIENDKIVFSIEGEHVLQIGYLYAENTKGGKLINYEENIFQKEDEEYYLYRVPLLINGKGKMRKISKTRFLLEVIIRKLVNSWLFLFIVLVFIIAISYLR